MPADPPASDSAWLRSGVAQVRVSLPDELLVALDDTARRVGLSRSAYVEDLVRADLADRQAKRAAEMARVDGDGVTGHGGDVAGVLRRYRPRRHAGRAER